MIVDLEKRWLKQAKCKGMGTDLFFADHGELGKGRTVGPKIRKQWDAAKEVCIECPVMLQCGRDSLGETIGVWGGYDPIELRMLRGKHSAKVRNLPPGRERREYAELAYRLARTPRYGTREAARIMGLAFALVGHLIGEHEAVLKARQAACERRAAKAATNVVDLPLGDAQWPTKAPEQGDGWVRHHGTVVHAYYLGETEDGEWFFLKAPLSKEDSRSWFRKRDVKLTREVPPHHMTRVGKTSRIYGTTISAPFAADRAG